MAFLSDSGGQKQQDKMACQSSLHRKHVVFRKRSSQVCFDRRSFPKKDEVFRELDAGFTAGYKGSKVRLGHYDRLLSLPVGNSDFRNQSVNGYYSLWAFKARHSKRFGPFCNAGRRNW